MRLLWQLTIFCTALWLGQAEVISNDNKEVFVYEEQLDFKDVALYNQTFIYKENKWLREKRAVPGTSTDPDRSLKVLTFNIQNYFSTGSRHARDPTIVSILSRAHLVVLQEMRDAGAAGHLLNLLNNALTSPMYRLAQSGPLPPTKTSSRSRQEWYAFLYRYDRLMVKKTHQFPPIVFSNGKVQTRPPYAVQFQYSRPGCVFDFSVLPTHTIPDSTSIHTTRQEIDNLRTNMNDLLAFPCCTSPNAIILGDFNQVPRYVLSNYRSALAKDPNVKEVPYTGSSSALTQDPRNQLDRIYVHGHLTKATPCQALVLRHSFTKDVSDHYPLLFEIDTTLAKGPGTGTGTGSSTGTGTGTGSCPFPTMSKTKACSALVDRPAKRQRTSRQSDEEEIVDCNACIGAHLSGGVHPSGAASSSSILKMPQPIIKRGDQMFFSLFYFEGRFVVFRNEEVTAEWCGSPGQPCANCNSTSFIESIADQCTDRIMCPTVAQKLMDLSLSVDSCYPNRSVIVHEAWDEANSDFPDGRSSMDTLHRHGLELEISISEEMSDESDDSVYVELASLAVCIGFEYVKINDANKTVSVAMSQCSTGNISVITCVEPLLSNGRYLGDHEGPIYQRNENIHAVCTPGYTLVGPITRECQSNSEWSDEDPTCELVCEQLPVPNCATPVYDFIHGTVTFECQTGCVPMGENSPLRCNRVSRQFVGSSSFTCVSVTVNENSTCPLLGYVRNGNRAYIHGTPGEVGSVVQFSCYKGSRLVGEQILTCQPDFTWDYHVPTCISSQTFTDFNVIGFDYVRSNIPVNLQDLSSVAAATYTGRISRPYPPFVLPGQFNSTTTNVEFGQDISLPFGGLFLEYSVDVNLDLLLIVQRFFHGRIMQPVTVDVTGLYNVIECLIDLTGFVHVPAEDVSVDTGVVLELCDNCSRICSAQAVRLSVDLNQPWNISLNGSYMLANQVRSVELGGAVSIQGYEIEVFTSVQSGAGGVNLSTLFLRIELPNPINVTAEGFYSRDLGIATLSGRLNLQQIMLSLGLRANIVNRSLSEVRFSGSLTTPFSMMLFGSYSLTPKSPFLALGGTIGIDSLLNLTLMAQAHLDTRVLSNFMLTGMLNIQPLRVAVWANYDALPSGNLHLFGSISIQEGTHAIMVETSLNTTTDPVSILEIALSGVFPPPLDFVDFRGMYNRHCSCAFLQGSLTRGIYDLKISTNLTFHERTEITSLQVEVNFHRPLNLRLVGEYSYNGNSSMRLIDVQGMFNIPMIINFDTELELILQGMDPILSRLHFVGTFPSPIPVQVMGDYNRTTNEVALMGDLTYSFAQLHAMTRYQFMDDVHNTSAMLVDLQLVGILTSPFMLQVKGSYMFSTEMLRLSGSLEVSQYLDLSANVHVNTSSMPVSIDFISFAGTFMTPIPFNGQFEGNFNPTSRKALLVSSLNIGPVQFTASTNLFIQNNPQVASISSVQIHGTTASPLSMYVEGSYIPDGNTTALSLGGNITASLITFVGSIRAEADPVSNSVMITMARFVCLIDDPFQIMLKGTYDFTDLLIVTGTIDGIPIISLQASITLNVTAMPRQVNSIQFTGQLNSPLSGRVSANYMLSSGDALVLTGETEIGRQYFMVQVIFNTVQSPLMVRVVRFSTTFDPLSLMLVGEYTSGNQRIDLMGVFAIQVPAINVTASTFIDLSGNSSSLSYLSITARFTQPPLILSGEYNSTSQDAFLTGNLNFSAVNLLISACARLNLGSPKTLEAATLSIDYMIKFGDMQVFSLMGTYDYSTSMITLEGRLKRSKRSAEIENVRSRRNVQQPQSGNDQLFALLLLSTSTSPTIQVAALRIPDLNIGNLMNTYLSIPWPADNFPIIFRDLAVYRAYVNVTHNQIAYQEGFRARGLVKLFVFPTFRLEASLTFSPKRKLVASLMLQDAIDWGLFAICGGGDPSCSMTGPSLSIEVGSGSNIVKFEGGFRLFQLYIGTIDLFVSKKYLNACLTLSDEITNNLPGLVPMTIKMYWNDEGFHISLPIPSLDIPNFSLNDIGSSSICQAIGGTISSFLINAPLDLQTSFFANREGSGTIYLGVIFYGSVDLNIAQSQVLSVKIKPIAFNASLTPGTALTWGTFRDLIKEAIIDHRQQIVDDILSNADAAALFLGSQLIQKALGAEAQAICQDILAAAAADAAAGAAGAAAAGAGIAAATGATILHGISSILGSGDSDDDGGGDDGGGDGGGGDGDSSSTLFSCNNGFNGWCEQNCSVQNNMIVCSCVNGYYPDRTSCIRFDRCENMNDNPCDDHAICMDPPQILDIMCVCRSGYTGDGRTCTDINECSEGNPCPANSNCTNTDGSFVCTCLSGFREQHDGSSPQCNDIDECSEGTFDCPMHSTCSNSPGSYDCLCDNGFRLNGSACIDIDECSMGDVCGVHGMCNNTEGSFVCTCEDGYMLMNATHCIDINECEVMSPCGENATCSNTDGSFVCACNSGFMGDGFQCNDINECEDQPCDMNATCTNTVGSYLCQCNLGFTGNGTNCTDIDECAEPDMAGCAEAAVCINSIGSYICTCIEGYSGNGTHCEDINECAEVPQRCDLNANCTNLPGSYECTCDRGFTGDGVNCSDIDECQNGHDDCDRQFGICENTIGSYNCSCKPGFTGDGLMCSLVNCGEYPLPSHASYVVNSGTMFNQTISVQCLPGFEPRNITTTTCQANGKWDTSAPNCTAEVLCPDPVSPMDGMVTYATPLHMPHVGSIILYTCNDGFALIGSSMARCQLDGNWSSPIPKCFKGVDRNDLYPFGPTVGDGRLPRNDDEFFPVNLSIVFPYFDEGERSLFVDNNGAISFRIGIRQYTPDPFPLDGTRIIAPFWADVDTRLPFLGDQFEMPPEMENDTGNAVWFREEFNEQLLRRAQKEIREAYVQHSNFVPSWLFIVTWDSVGYYSRHIDKLNTFQCILVTDGRLSFAIFHYVRGGIQWTTGDASNGMNGLGGIPAQVGFNAGDGIRFASVPGSRTNDIINIDEKSNIFRTGVFIYQVDGVSVAPAGCSASGTIQLSLVAQSSLGGKLIAISGPCFKPNSTITCFFGDVRTEGVIQSSLRAYCVPPNLNQYGIVTLRVSVDNGVEQNEYSTSFTLLSQEELSDIDVVLHGLGQGLLQYDNDRITLMWNPNNIVNPDLVPPTAYSVDVEVYWYDVYNNMLNFADRLATDQNNTGVALDLSFTTLDFVQGYIVPIVYRIVPRVRNPSLIPDYLLPFFERQEIGIFSSTVFKVTQTGQEDRIPDLCRDWISQHNRTVGDMLSAVPCPCNVRQARRVNSGFFELRSQRHASLRRLFHPGAESCFVSTLFGPNGEGQECCYDASGNLLVGAPSGGHVELAPYRILSSPWPHYERDLIPEIYCCHAVGSPRSLCQKFYEVLPSDNCSRYNPDPPAFLFGDPHFVTLDGKPYTFNGAGEYVIIDALNKAFLVQARSEPAERVDGGQPVGTVFTAVAAKTNNSVPIEVQKSSLRGINILVDGERLPLTEPREWQFAGVVISYEGNSSVFIRFDSGESLHVQVRNSILMIELAACPDEFRNQTRGLLGNWNGDPVDDFLRPNGDILSTNASMEDIHFKFGEEWRVASGLESLFTYNPGQSVETYNDTNFVPVFDPTELPFFNMSGATEVCGDSLECLFDVGSTGLISVGNLTMEAQISFNETLVLSEPVVCNPACQNGAPCVGTNVCSCHSAFMGTLCELDVDECTSGQHNCEHVCQNTLNGFTCSCNPGYTLSVDEASCDDTNECLEENGGCRCDVERNNCTICVNHPGSHVCKCVDGYTLDSDGLTCSDVDECLVNNGGCRCDEKLNGCSATCSNVAGSFTCVCEEGYYLEVDGVTCNKSEATAETPTSIEETPASTTSPDGRSAQLSTLEISMIAVGAALGIVALCIVLIVLICIICVKWKKKAKKYSPEPVTVTPNPTTQDKPISRID